VIGWQSAATLRCYGNWWRNALAMASTCKNSFCIGRRVSVNWLIWHFRSHCTQRPFSAVVL